jgi:DoxX-like protein
MAIALERTARGKRILEFVVATAGGVSIRSVAVRRLCRARGHTGTQIGKRETPIVTYALWIVQILLAALFAFSGSMKLIVPLDVLAAQSPVVLPGVFVRFIGVCEVLGALGLVLPGLLHIRTDLTPRAAQGLIVIMVGAAMFTPQDQIAMVVLPIAVGALAAFVAYGRSRLAPLANGRSRRAARRPVLQAAS